MSAEKKIVYAEDVLTAVCMYCDSHIEFCDTCPMKDAIMDAPDAERCGEWVESEDLESALKGKVVCSICGEPQFAIEITNEFLRLKNQKTKYCPNCGAKMTKGE